MEEEATRTSEAPTAMEGTHLRDRKPDSLRLRRMENLHIESKTTAYKLFKLESFPSIKIGRKYIVPLSAYNKWIKNVTNSEIYL